MRLQFDELHVRAVTGSRRGVEGPVEEADSRPDGVDVLRAEDALRRREAAA